LYKNQNTHLGTSVPTFLYYNRMYVPFSIEKADKLMGVNNKNKKQKNEEGQNLALFHFLLDMHFNIRCNSSANS
jgi:hypothetical protein